MTGETLYPRLEPLLAQIQKPIQYVGGELNAQVKPWDGAAVHWALMYPDAYEVGLPNQGLMILYEVLNERPDALAERTYAVWPDLAALMRENGVPQFTVDGHRAVARLRPARRQLRHRARLHQPARGARPRRRPDARRRPRRDATPSSSPAGTPRSTPSRSPTSSTAPSSATASRSSATSPTSSRRGRSRAARRPRRAARPPRPRRRRLRAALLRGLLRPGRRDRGGHPHPGRRPRADRQAHRHGPRRVALPEDAARAAGRDRCTSG